MSFKICIDPGHGGKDPGAIGYGLHEADVVLKLAKMLNDEFGKYPDVIVTLTRWDNRYLTLQQRCDHANKMNVDLFVSLHSNAAPASAVGFESYVYSGLSASATAVKKQSVIHSHTMSYLKKHNIRDRGKKKAGYYVVKNTRMPAILIENLFITNKQENDLLRNDSFLRGLAEAIAGGIALAYGLKKKAEPKPEPEPVQKPMYRVTVDGKVIYDTAYHSKLTEVVLDGINSNANEITLKRL